MRKGPASLGILALAAATSLGVSGRARATEILTTPIQTLSIPLTQTDWGPTTSSLAGLNPFQIQRFNASAYDRPDLGLTAQFEGVSLTLDYQFNNTISMRFDNVSTITVNASGNMRLTMPDNTTQIVSPQPTFTNSGTQTSSPSDVFSKFVTLPTSITTGTSTGNYAASSTIAQQFVGTGTINLPVFATATSSFTTTSGNGFGSSVTLATATIRLFYRYTLVPEPASVVLAGIGLLGLLTLARTGTRSRSLTCR